MTRRQPIFAVMAILLLPSWSLGADPQESPSGSQASDDQAYGDIQARTNGQPVCLCQPVRYSQWDVRFGWWAMSHTGSPAKVGEYQDVKSSPFFDLDGFSSDSRRTLGVTATGTDQETTVGKFYYYQPSLSADVDYERFLHRRDHDPLNNMADLDPTRANNAGGNDPLVMKQDLNVGQDYAVRVQELKGSFKWTVSDNLKARLDIWGMQKEGLRQTNLTAMCYNVSPTVLAPPPPDIPANKSSIPPDGLGPHGDPLGSFTGGRCHVLSVAQHINWTTTEIKPVIEWKLGDRLVIEYSRPIRGFTADDQTVSRFYNATGVLSYNPSTSNNTAPNDTPNTAPYATGVVPNSYTQMDQVKISGRLGEDTRAYAFLMAGNTLNQEIGMNRSFNDVDVRLTNTSITNTTLTGYGTIFNETEPLPSQTAVTSLERYNSTRGVEKDFQPTLSEPIDYHKSTAGLKGVWRARGGGFDRGGLAIVGGYEYGDLERDHAVFESETSPVVIVDDKQMITHSFQVGPDYRWSASLDTYVRYKYQNAVQPLIGFKALNGTFNTSLPQHDNIVELGFNWVPADWFIFNACIGIERGDNHSQFANFDEESYPMSFSAWYAVSNRLSLSAGYAVYSNFVAQDITLGDDAAGAAVAPVTSRWNYGGRAQVVTLGSRYAATARVTLTGEVEWVRGHNMINNSATFFPYSNTTVADFGLYSEVFNESTRLRVGVDYLIRPRVVAYGRYELYNFKDMNPGFQTGFAHGVLGGLSALF